MEFVFHRVQNIVGIAESADSGRRKKKSFLPNMRIVVIQTSFVVRKMFLKFEKSKINGWVQHYPKCLYKVKALKIVLHSPIEMFSFWYGVI